MTNERTIFDRLLALQKKIGAITKDQTNPHFDHRYADINTVLGMIKPILNEEGVLVMQSLTNVDGIPAMKTTLMCENGKIEEVAILPPLPQPLPNKRGNPSQEMGSSITYFRRYALSCMLALQSVDDDGHSAAQPEAPQKEKPKPKAQPEQTGNVNEIPTCSICHQPMKHQKNDKTKFFCKHDDDGNVKWGKPVYQKKVV